jgi:hypothetical protein
VIRIGSVEWDPRCGLDCEPVELVKAMHLAVWFLWANWDAFEKACREIEATK